MLSMLGMVKFLAGKNAVRNYKGAHVKCIIVTVIECISGDGEYLDSIMI